MAKIKIFYLMGSNDGCGYYRAYLPGIHLDKEKFEVYFSHPDDCFEKNYVEMDKSLDRGLQMLNSNIVVFQRALLPEKLLLMYWLKKKGIKVVYENDDWFEDPEQLSWIRNIFKGDIEAMKLMVEGADLVTTTTPALKRYFMQWNLNVEVLPNSIDFSLWKRKKRKKKKLVILLTGTAAFLENSEFILPILEKIKDKCQIVAQGIPNPEKFSSIKEQYPKIYQDMARHWEKYKEMGIKTLPFVPVLKYPKLLSKIDPDICLIPRNTELEHNRYKSNIKFVEMAALKVPVIATPIEPYKEIEDKKTGFLAQSREEWEEKINLLLNDEKLREEIGENAYQYCKGRYSIQENVKLWERAYLKLWFTSSKEV